MKKIFIRTFLFVLLFLGILIYSYENVVHDGDDTDKKDKLIHRSNNFLISQKSDDWEQELDRELKDQETKQKAFTDSRGTNSPVSLQNQVNRSSQNLMMDVFVAMDIVGEYDKNKPKTTDNKLDIRTAEFGFNAAVDQWLRGYFLSAAHSENGKYFFEIHEAWVQLPFLPFNTSLKAGMMFLDIGRLNRIHIHDRPFTRSPIVHEKLLDWESIFDTGAEMSILFPWKFITQELVIGSTNGKKWGHAHSEGLKKNNPMFYSHLKNFYYFGNNVGSQFGITGIRYEVDSNNTNQKYMYGADFLVRWNRSNLREFQFLSEYWYSIEKFNSSYDLQTNKVSNPEDLIRWGYYAFLDYKFHQLWSVGYRYDFYTDRSTRNSRNLNVLNFIEANSLQVTFHSSEFAYFRGTLERRFILDESLESDKDKIDQRFLIQAVAILGSHPAHAY